jgi:hypothetical protein
MKEGPKQGRLMKKARGWKYHAIVPLKLAMFLPCHAVGWTKLKKLFGHYVTLYITLLWATWFLTEACRSEAVVNL